MCAIARGACASSIVSALPSHANEDEIGLNQKLKLQDGRDMEKVNSTLSGGLLVCHREREAPKITPASFVSIISPAENIKNTANVSTMIV